MLKISCKNPMRRWDDLDDVFYHNPNELVAKNVTNIADDNDVECCEYFDFWKHDYSQVKQRLIQTAENFIRHVLLKENIISLKEIYHDIDQIYDIDDFYYYHLEFGMPKLTKNEIKSIIKNIMKNNYGRKNIRF